MTYFLMYLLTIVDNIPVALAPVTVLLGIGSLLVIVALAGYTIDGDDDFLNKLRPLFKRVICSFIVCLSNCIFTPSSKGIAFIYIAPQIIENGAVKDTVKNIPELTKLGTEYLKEILADKIQETK